MQEKYIITGATGLVGNNLVRKLDKKHADLTLIVLPEENISYLPQTPNITIKYGNVLDRDFLKKEIQPDSIVIHVAGIVDISSANKDMVYKVNVEGTKNICDICLQNKVKKLIYTSSVHAIKPLTKHKEMSEPNKFNPDEIIGDYAKSKAMATNYVFECIDKGLNATVVYPSGIIGPNDYKVSNTAQLILDIANKKIKARVNGGYNFVDVRDVCNGILLACEKGKNEGYILSGEKISIDGIFECIDKFLGRKKWTPKIATWFVKMFASLAERYYTKRNKKPLFTKYSLYTITSNCNFSNKKAKKELGYNPRNIKTSIINTLVWFYKKKPELLEEETKLIIKTKLSKLTKPKKFLAIIPLNKKSKNKLTQIDEDDV